MSRNKRLFTLLKPQKLNINNYNPIKKSINYYLCQHLDHTGDFYHRRLLNHYGFNWYDLHSWDTTRKARRLISLQKKNFLRWQHRHAKRHQRLMKLDHRYREKWKKQVSYFQ